MFFGANKDFSRLNKVYATLFPSLYCVSERWAGIFMQVNKIWCINIPSFKYIIVEVRVLMGMKWTGGVVFLLAGILVAGCGGGDGEDVVEKSSFQMPVKENTWVRKETVRTTKDDFISSGTQKNIEVPVDPALVTKLNTPTSLSINTKQECLAQANTLDDVRTLVQKRGGMWHAYERLPKAKPYSNYGMQLDSQTNRLVFSLKQICKNNEGVQLTGWGEATVRMYEQMGKEAYRKHYVELGEAPGDIDKWVEFAESSIQSRNRKVPYSQIGESLAGAKLLVNLYDELSQRTINNDTALQTFLTEGATLLSVINESFKSDPRLSMSIQDENLYPFEDLKGQM